MNLQLACIFKQCSAKTMNNTDCRRNATKEFNGKNFCWMHHRIIDPNYKNKDLIKIDSKKDECSICYYLLDKPENIAITNCKHIFHISCLNSWKDAQILQNVYSTCPLCRKKLTLYRGRNKKLKIIMTNMDITVKVSTI